MKHTEVLKYLVDTLREEGLIQYDKSFLLYINISKDIVSPTQLSGFLNRIGDIQKKEFLKKIEECFNFSSALWSTNEIKQKKLIHDAIEEKLKLASLPNENALNISNILETRKPISKEQVAKLTLFSKQSEIKDIETMIDTFSKLKLLSKKPENQEFLVGLLKLSYEKGIYSIIRIFILPNLYRKYALLPEVQKIEAHTLGSLGQYDDAKYILDELIYHNTIENIDLRTSALSNYKRELFSSASLIEEDELYTLIKGYQELHAINGIYSYYTGINLLYMVILGQISFPRDTRFTEIDSHNIYTLSKPSLTKDTTEYDYYVSISTLEFRLLLGYDGVLERLESFLDDKKPHVSLVERTLRQMQIFARNSTNREHPTIVLFQKAMTLLSDFCNVSKS